MFQHYAANYRHVGGDQEFGIVSVIEVGQRPAVEIPKMIACREYGDPKRADEIEILELVRLGAPRETP